MTARQLLAALAVATVLSGTAACGPGSGAGASAPAAGATGSAATGAGGDGQLAGMRQKVDAAQSAADAADSDAATDPH